MLVYLDNASTTACDPRVVSAMLPTLTEQFANPHQQAHQAGRNAAQLVSLARQNVAEMLGPSVTPNEIAFTSGATEANNMVLLGLASTAPHDRRRIVSTTTEHSSILGPLAELQDRGFEVILLPVDSDGVVDSDAAARVIDTSTLLVSVHLVNGETGTTQPVADFARRAHEAGAIMHTDAAQAAGRIPVDVDELGVDMLTLSGHKFHAPKGIGALYVRRGASADVLPSIMFGGGQEHGLRPGTLHVPGIVGLGEACNVACSALPSDMHHIQSLRCRLEKELLRALPGSSINSAGALRAPGTLSFQLPEGMDASVVMRAHPWLACSTTSACASGGVSHVLTAMGRSHDEARRTLRLGLSRFTTASEVDRVIAAITPDTSTLREPRHHESQLAAT